MNAENTGKLIRDLRKEKGWTQQELASALHVTDGAVSKWERGKSMPDSSIMQSLCKELGLQISELLSGERGNTEMSVKDSVALVVELADREKARKAKALNYYFVLGLLFLTGAVLLKEMLSDHMLIVLLAGLGIAFEIAGFYTNNKNSRNQSFTAREIHVLMSDEREIQMKTAEELLQFAKKYQSAEFKQYRLAFEEIAKQLGEEEAAVFSAVGETYLINEGIGMNYPALAATNSRVLIGGESIRGRLMTKYVVDIYDKSEILSVRMVNRRLVLKTPKAEIKIEGKNLEQAAEKLKEYIKS